MIKSSVMGKGKKSLSILEKDLQILNTEEMAKIFGGKIIRKNKWNKGLGGVMPE